MTTIGPLLTPEIERVGCIDWSVRLPNITAFDSSLNRAVRVGAVDIPLVPYKPKSAQAFVCKKVPKQVPLADLASVLLTGLKPHHIHLMQTSYISTKKARGKNHVVVFLDSPVELEYFGYAAPCGMRRQTWSARFNAQARTCTFCGSGDHSQGSCLNLRTVTGDHENHPRWLTYKPQLEV
ncbi:hypothetical protein LTR86_009565 [Recurvomyces mirabilis]|nr:hypothetical protein LTR86_009565 [Recurvomyces mirabilis]